ncbi:MAG: Asp-tRNA(Asn)/Glu-tRNA(Gln) amidotransferase subunit GatB [Candidatus Curtissbacteria bacterium]|nr:Asp-tRNA(Asn)/Glu-tRNA(Gln) amidotransferase subunit GatB [Candidatus Curtissbacteria bacterium]
MSQQYNPVIGLEVHVETNTKTKMFCACSDDYFGKEPNTHTCPVCLGLPGALPFTNEEAIEKCMKIGLALNCKVAESSLFERKNYFYPDLAKGYQISQYRWPLCVGGSIEVTGKNGKKSTIRINRAHQEEDTGKLTHVEGRTLIDFNRSGVPLVEIVTEPDFTDTEQIRDYAKQLREIFRNLGVSNADMEKGDMRLEANISVRPVGQKELPNYRVELKNINSFRFMVAAVEFEIKRQIEALESGETLHQETRGWNEAKHETYLQRSKEEANDYRYFPEPDLPSLAVDRDLVKKLQEEARAALPQTKVDNLVKTYGISQESAVTMIRQGSDPFFEELVAKLGQTGISSQIVASMIINKKIDWQDLSTDDVVKQLKAQASQTALSSDQLEKAIDEVIADNEKTAADYKAGKENALQALIGAVMKKTSGRADAKQAAEIIKEKLK